MPSMSIILTDVRSCNKLLPLILRLVRPLKVKELQPTLSVFVAGCDITQIESRYEQCWLPLHTRFS